MHSSHWQHGEIRDPMFHAMGYRGTPKGHLQIHSGELRRSPRRWYS